MKYEINVSLKGEHLFATHERSITTTGELKRVCKIFKEKFPESEGYKLLVVECPTTQTRLTLEEIINE